MTDHNLPTLRGQISYSGPDCCQIEVFCPYCNRYHLHGWPDRTLDPDHLEHRAYHCSSMASPYRKHGYLIGIDSRRHNRERHP